MAVATIGIVALRVYTALMAPAVFGDSNLILSALGLGVQLFVAGFTAALLRFYTEARAPEDAVDFSRATLVWALRSASLLAVLLLLLVAALAALHVVAYSIGTIASGIAWLYATSLRNVLMCRIQAQRRQSAYAGLQVLEAALLVVVTVGALEVRPSAQSFILGQTLAMGLLIGILVATEPAARALFGRAANRGSLSARAWAYGAPFAPLSLLSWLANLGDRYTLAAMLGAASAGRYVAPFSVASRGMVLVNSALCDLFRPILFDAENRGDAAAARTTFRRWILSSIALSLVGLVTVHAGGSLIARWLLAPAYRDGAVEIMLWVSLGYAVNGVTQVIESRLLSLGHSARLLLPMLLGAIANLAFSILLIRYDGIVGAAQATCASFLFQQVATLGFLLHAQRQRRAEAQPEDPLGSAKAL